MSRKIYLKREDVAPTPKLTSEHPHSGRARVRDRDQLPDLHWRAKLARLQEKYAK